MNIVIIGCGLIGRKRALALDDKDKLIAKMKIIVKCVTLMKSMKHLTSQNLI